MVKGWKFIDDQHVLAAFNMGMDVRYCWSVDARGTPHPELQRWPYTSPPSIRALPSYVGLVKEDEPIEALEAVAVLRLDFPPSPKNGDMYEDKDTGRVYRRIDDEWMVIDRSDIGHEGIYR